MLGTWILGDIANKFFHLIYPLIDGVAGNFGNCICLRYAVDFLTVCEFFYDKYK